MDAQRKGLWMFVVGGLIVALALAFFVSPLASSSPDGLNRVAIDKGFADREAETATADSPLAGYGVKGMDSESLSTGLAGIIGVALVFGIGLILSGVLVRMPGRRRVDMLEPPRVAPPDTS